MTHGRYIPLMRRERDGQLLELNFDKLLLATYQEIALFQRCGFEIPQTANEVFAKREDMRLLREHVLLVGGAACVTLGHGLRGDVVGHSYWGGAVLADLSRQPGWTQGFVLLRPGQLQGQLAAANAAESSLAAGLVSAEA